MNSVMKRKVLFGAVAIVLFGLWFAIYTSFNGNPIRLWQIKGQVNRYLAETHPNTAFTAIRPYYNFKFGNYAAHVESVNPPLTFNVEIYRGEFRDNFIAQKLEQEMRAELSPILKTTLGHVSSWSLKVYHEGEEKLTDRSVYSREMEGLVAMMDIRWQGPSITKDEFIDQVLATMEKLGAEGFNISRYFFVYQFPGTDYMLSLNDGEKEWSREMMLYNISVFENKKNMTIPTPTSK